MESTTSDFLNSTHDTAANAPSVDTVPMASKTLAKLSVNKAVEQYQYLEKKALDALKARFPKTLAAYEQSNDSIQIRKLNQDLSNRIDATIAVYLPKIESELRKTLESEAIVHMQQLLKQNRGF